MNRNSMLLLISFFCTCVHAMEVREAIPAFYLGIVTNNTGQDVSIVDSDSQQTIAMVGKKTTKNLALAIKLNRAHKAWFKKLLVMNGQTIYLEIDHELFRVDNQQFHKSHVFLYYKTKFAKNPVLISEWRKDDYRVHENDYLIQLTLDGKDFKDSVINVQPLQQTTRKELELFEK